MHLQLVTMLDYSAGDDGEEGGDVTAVLPDIHQASDGAARDGAPPDNHGHRHQAPAGEQGGTSAPAAEEDGELWRR